MDHIKRQCITGQVKRFVARFAQGVGSALGKVISEREMLKGVEAEAGHFRERVYGPVQVLVLFIEQVLGADQSCQDAVARGLSQRVALGQTACSLNNGPYCKARARLKLGFVKRLGQEVGHRLTAAQTHAWRWRDREVKLVDGTTVSMPDTSANQATYPQSKAQKAGLGFPLARVVAIISLSCGAVLEWAVGPCKGKGTGETAMLWALAPHFRPSDVVVMDRYFSGYFLMAWLIQHQVDVVVRQHQIRVTDFRRGKRLGKRDHVVRWWRPRCPTWMDAEEYETMPTSLELRETRMGDITLVTTFTNVKEVDKRELFALYKVRWQIELDLRSIKTVMQMEILRCKSPAMVEKEIAVHLLAYNLVRAIMAQAAAFGHVEPRKLSFKAALQLIRAFGDNLRHAPNTRRKVCVQILLAGISQLRLRDRPDRVEPRAVKRRPKPFPLLTKPRSDLKKALLKRQNRNYQNGLR